jgi:hypothetical protein
LWNYGSNVGDILSHIKKKYPPVVYRHLTTGGLWYNVYTTEYTTNHNPLVVYRHLTTGWLQYNV